ncbi:MAG: hypothetical protein V9G20_26675 [Candidatus Promineifilaceae bacterium]
MVGRFKLTPGNVPDNIIPAYEEGIPISVTLHFEHLWQGITLTNVVVTERVQAGFTVHPGQYWATTHFN